MTANSFTSVSLTPPLVLWSASLYADSLAAFQEGSHFVVNILAHDQIELSNKFARKHENACSSLARARLEHAVRSVARRVPPRVPFAPRTGSRRLNPPTPTSGCAQPKQTNCMR